VSGAAKEEADMIIYEIFGKDSFDVIINGDQFEGKGKPDPVPFKAVLEFQQLTAHIFKYYHIKYLTYFRF
jgi:hypothetical protein